MSAIAYVTGEPANIGRILLRASEILNCFKQLKPAIGLIWFTLNGKNSRSIQHE